MCVCVCVRVCTCGYNVSTCRYNVSILGKSVGLSAQYLRACPNMNIVCKVINPRRACARVTVIPLDGQPK